MSEPRIEIHTYKLRHRWPLRIRLDLWWYHVVTERRVARRLGITLDELRRGKAELQRDLERAMFFGSPDG